MSVYVNKFVKVGVEWKRQLTTLEGKGKGELSKVGRGEEGEGGDLKGRPTYLAASLHRRAPQIEIYDAQLAAVSLPCPGQG